MNFRKFLSVPLTIMLATGMPWSGASAYEDTTQPVEVNSGETVDVGNVTVDGSQVGEYPGYAVKIETEGTENEKAKATVHGNVTLKNAENSNQAVIADASNGDVKTAITGSVDISYYPEGNDGEIYGIFARSVEGRKAEVTVDNTVSATNQNGSAEGIEMGSNTEVTVKKGISAVAKNHAEAVVNRGGILNVGETKSGWQSISAEAEQATGLRAIDTGEGTTVNTIGRNISVKGLSAIGAMLATGGEDTANLILKVGDTNKEISGTTNITAESTGGSDSDAIAMRVGNSGGHILADVAGDVIAKSPIGIAIGIMIGAYDLDISPTETPGTSDILIRRNLTSDGVGINQLNIGPWGTTTNVLVENEINAKKAGVMIIKIPTQQEEDGTAENKLNLTVWKIKLNKNGNAAVYDDPEHPSDGEDECEPARDFEKSIMYIIKVEQPQKGGTIKAVKADGSALEKSFEYEVAREGDKILIKPTLKDGFEIVAAYNGLGEKIELTKDENGNYYLIVPKGGGVYLSVLLKETNNHHNHGNNTNPDKKGGNTYSDYVANATESQNEKISYNKSNFSAIKTGDDDHIIPWLLLSTLSIGGIVALEIYNKKKILKEANQK